jgi:hypothetical protein
MSPQKAQTEKVTWQAILLMVVLLALFPALWLFNQRLNFRKFLTLNTRFGLNANTYPADQLSDPTLILKYLQKYDPSFVITSKMDTVAGFDVLSRELTNGRDFIEVYEYQSPRAASAKLKNFNTKPELYGQISSQLYRYKNVLIYNKSTDENIRKLLEQLINEPNI